MITGWYSVTLVRALIACRRLGIPTLLIGHVVGTRLAWEAFDQSPQYARVVWSLWATDGQGRQLALLVPGWLHGCLGIHLAFAKRPLYRRLRWALFAAALLLPVLGGRVSTAPSDWPMTERPGCSASRKRCSPSISAPLPRSSRRAQFGPFADRSVRPADASAAALIRRRQIFPRRQKPLSVTLFRSAGGISRRPGRYDKRGPVGPPDGPAGFVRRSRHSQELK